MVITLTPVGNLKVFTAQLDAYDEQARRIDEEAEYTHIKRVVARQGWAAHGLYYMDYDQSAPGEYRTVGYTLVPADFS